MNRIILITVIALISISAKAQQTGTLLYNWQETNLVGSWAYNNTYNECWGLEVNGSEIAIIGSTDGTHFFNVTDPTNATQVAYVAGAYQGGGVVHRDYHDFQGYLYVVCDEGSSSTLQIIDISTLPDSVTTVYDSNALFTKSHNIYIDTATAKLYACASNTAMDVYDLHTPTAPELIYSYNGVGHVHDAFVRNDSAYLNCGNDGFRIFDFSTVNQMGDQPTLLGALTSYPDAGYNHSGWLNDDGTVYVMQDENHGYDVKLLDVSDFNNISVLSTFSSGVDPQSMAHNGIIKGDNLYIPYYHDGLRVFDISDPYNPVQVCNYDTYPYSITYCTIHNNHLGYKGAWGVYPYLPSGNIIVSDMQTGLYIIDITSGTTNVIETSISNNIYPNPAKSQFIIENNSADNLKLFNSLGTEVMSKKLYNNQTTINRGNLANGLYFYSLNKEGKQIESGKVLFE
ncbi:MAG: choice-of-anchor B family protein [Flavobacteriales bacterium]|nr:choice-of-anchor B family protein [Flavobacteriales bacterium]